LLGLTPRVMKIRHNEALNFDPIFHFYSVKSVFLGNFRLWIAASGPEGHEGLRPGGIVVSLLIFLTGNNLSIFNLILIIEYPMILLKRENVNLEPGCYPF
jgi:hypothetical protein